TTTQAMGHGVVVLPEKIFWHHIVQTNTLLDSQTTNTHPTITRTIIRVINRGHPQDLYSSPCGPPYQRISTLQCLFDVRNPEFTSASPGSKSI
ncbi:hypothetical protein, partial [Brevibacterium sp. XM4083]|uniref:hypothetical protein n=1 Tax=Brevibacterium sp. XM4083 TaxID=2583238 RepID=UPI00202EF040